MSNPPAQSSDDSAQVTKQLGRRRTFGFFFGLAAVAFLEVAISEGDMLTHAFDDITIVAISAIAVILILAMRKKRSLPDLKRINNILFIIGVIFLVMTFVAISIEINDANDIGDDFPKIFISAALLLNRFL